MPRRCAAIVIAGSAITTGCSVDELTRDRLLVWHDWAEPEAAVLVELLDGYRDVNPDLDVIVEYVPEDELETRFATEVRSGFGPDVLIGADATNLEELVDQGAVRRIPPDRVEHHGFGELDPKAVEAMEIDTTTWGIPLAAFTDVLYHRTEVTPPATLDDVVELAEDGHLIAIPTGFIDAYWGVDAFDGAVFDAAGEVDPDDGFVEWMNWLVDARPNPNIIMDGEYEVLRDGFAAGRIDVFVGGSRELGTFRAALREPVAAVDDDEGPDDDGEEDDDDVAPLRATAPTVTDTDVQFGLTVLPAGDNDEPGGLMDVEGMVVNRHTSSFRDALELMAYLTNVPSQGRIARSGVGRIPVNGAVSIDPTISPIEAALVTQQRRATVLPRAGEVDRTPLWTEADDVVAQVIRGLLEPADAPDALRDAEASLEEHDDG